MPFFCFCGIMAQWWILEGGGIVVVVIKIYFLKNLILIDTLYLILKCFIQQKYYSSNISDWDDCIFHTHICK